MIGSSGAGALSRASGDEQLLKTQALNNEERQKRQQERPGQKDHDDADGSEESPDSFIHTAEGAQERLENEGSVARVGKKSPQRMRIAPKELKDVAKSTLEPTVNKDGHIDVKG